MSKPMPDEIKIIHDVSLSQRYRKMMVWKKQFTTSDLTLMPTMLFFLRQN